MRSPIAQNRAASQDRITPRIARVTYVGTVETTGIKCSRCDRPVHPKDVEKIRRAICGICPTCHVDLFRIDLQCENDEEI